MESIVADNLFGHCGELPAGTDRKAASLDKSVSEKVSNERLSMKDIQRDGFLSKEVQRTATQRTATQHKC